MKLFLIAGLLGASTWTQPSERQFDVVCDAFHYRVDLDAGLWCVNECRERRKIVRVDSDMLVLKDIRPTADSPTTQYNRINLKTGMQEAAWWDAGKKPDKVITACRSDAFSGLSPGS